MLEEKIAALREGYRRTTLPQQLDALRAKLAHAQGGGAEALAEAARLAHRVKGTAGSYGFEAVAAELEGIEAILERAERGGIALGPADRDALDGALARARASLEESGPGLS